MMHRIPGVSVTSLISILIPRLDITVMAEDIEVLLDVFVNFTQTIFYSFMTYWKHSVHIIQKNISEKAYQPASAHDEGGENSCLWGYQMT